MKVKLKFNDLKLKIFRAVKISADHKNFYVNKLKNQEVQGCISDSYYEVLYVNQNLKQGTKKTFICKDVYMTIPSVIYTVKEFYLIDTLNDCIEKLKASGLVEYWHKRVFDERILLAKESKHPKVIKLHHLLGCFQIWFLGIILSAMVFMREYLTNFWVKCLREIYNNITNMYRV